MQAVCVKTQLVCERTATVFRVGNDDAMQSTDGKHKGQHKGVY